MTSAGMLRSGVEMPLKYYIDREQRLIFTEGSGVITDADVIALKEKLLRDPASAEAIGQLSDLRLIERLAVTTAGVHAMVRHDEKNEQARARRLAIVATEVPFRRALSAEARDGRQRDRSISPIAAAAASSRR